MKTLSVSILLILAAQLIFVLNDKDAITNVGPEDYKYLETRLDNAKAFTAEVFAAMPEAKYDFKPTEEVRSFKAQAFHIAYTLDWYDHRLKGKPVAWEPGDEERMSKEELATYLDAQFDKVKMTIMKSHGKDSLTDDIIGLLDHNAHHRGQMITYLRMNGIEAPGYR